MISVQVLLYFVLQQRLLKSYTLARIRHTQISIFIHLRTQFKRVSITKTMIVFLQSVFSIQLVIGAIRNQKTDLNQSYFTNVTRYFTVFNFIILKMSFFLTRKLLNQILKILFKIFFLQTNFYICYKIITHRVYVVSSINIFNINLSFFN